jgi:hypothetical protein
MPGNLNLSEKKLTTRGHTYRAGFETASTIQESAYAGEVPR